MTKAFQVETETQVLIAARDLVENGWGRVFLHRRRFFLFGKHIYCLLGALRAAANYSYATAHFNDAYGRAFEAVGRVVGTWDLPMWNDLHEKEDVLRALDRAIDSTLSRTRWGEVR